MPVQETSFAAHRQIRRCAPEMRARILGALRASPAPLTDEELQDVTGLNPSSERPRRIELVEAGEIVAAPITKITKSGRAAQAWTPATCVPVGSGQAPLDRELAAKVGNAVKPGQAITP